MGLFSKRSPGYRTLTSNSKELYDPLAFGARTSCVPSVGWVCQIDMSPGQSSHKPKDHWEALRCFLLAIGARGLR